MKNFQCKFFSLLSTGKIFLAAMCLALISGCAAIKGTSNTNNYEKIDMNSMIAIEQKMGDDAVGRKIEKMLAYQLNKVGLKSGSNSPKYKVEWGYDVVLDGMSSTAFTTISNPKQSAYVIGNTAYLNKSTSTAMTFIDDDAIYKKTIAVRIVDAATGKPAWTGNVTERGICSQIFVTAPMILSLMFEGFPIEHTNKTKTLSQTDDGPKELMSVFPADTNWRCSLR